MKKATEETYQYDAFISYRHTEPDITIAKKLIEVLEGYRLPHNIAKRCGAKRIGRVFRDREELPTTTDLSESIHQALINSKFLIVICSPRTPESAWVNKEIELFKAFHGAQKIQALLIEGEPGESFPQALQQEIIRTVQADGSVHEQVRELELLAADIRPEALKGVKRLAYGGSVKDDRKLLSGSLKLLKTEMLRCLAPMLGCRFDELYQRHLKRRFRDVALTSMAAILLMGSLTVYTLAMSRQVAAQRDNALSSQSLFLSDLSKQQFAKGDRVVAAMLALEALPKDLSKPDRPYVADAEAALWNAVTCSADRYIPYTLLKHDSYINSAHFNFDSSRVVTTSDDRTAAVWDVQTGRKTVELKGHTGKVVYAEFSPDGRKIVTSSSDKTAIVWDTQSGEKLSVLTGCKKEVYRAKFSPDGRKVVQATFDDFALVWDATSGDILYRLDNGSSQFFSAEFSPDGDRVVTTDNSSAVIVWDMDTGKPALRVDYPYEETKSGAKFSPDGNRIVAINSSGSKTDAAVVLDAHTGALLNTLEGHSRNVREAAFSKDGKSILTASQDNKIIIWDAANGQVLTQLERDGQELLNACYSLDGSFIVSEYEGDDAIVTVLWDARTYGEVKTFTSNSISNSQYFYATFSTDGSKMVSARDNKSILLWDTLGDGNVTRLPGHGGKPRSLEYSADGRYLLTTASDGKAILWDTAEGKLIKAFSFSIYAGFNAAFSADGRKVAVCSGDGTALLYDVAGGKETAVLSIKDNQAHYVAFSPDSTRIVTATGDKLAVVWDASTGAELFRIESDISIFHAEYSPDGSKIVTIPFRGQSGGLVEIWDAKTGKRVVRLDETVSLNNAVLSSDGKMMATVLFGNSVIWDMNTGKAISEFSVEDYDYSIKSCVFSPDDKQIITLLATKPPMVYNAKTGRKLYQLDGHNDIVNSATYSPDGSRIITASADGTAILWDADSGEEILRLQGRNKAIVDAFFSPDGKMVATQYEDSLASVWSVETGIELDRPEGVNTAFSPDCKSLATALDDGTIVLWPIKQLEDALSQARQMTEGRTFTEKERKEFFLE